MFPTSSCKSDNLDQLVCDRNSWTNNDEYLFIYSKLDIQHNENIILTTKFFNNDNIIIINYTKDNKPHNAFYDKKGILGVDFVITDVKDDEPQSTDADPNADPNADEDQPTKDKGKKQKKKQEIQAIAEYCYWLHRITTYTDENEQQSVINIDDLHSIKTETKKNTYVCAPCGSGKSYIVLEKDILAILNESNENKIIIPTDKITVAIKQYEAVKNLITKNGFNPNIVFYYEDLQKIKPKERRDAFNYARIVITCIDSIEKFDFFKHTHLLIDEFTNTLKRLTKTEKGNEQDKKDFQDYVFHLLKTSIVKCYDADIFKEMLDIVKFYTQKTFKIYNLVNFNQRNNKVILTNPKNALNECKQLLKQGFNIAIASTSKEYANTIQETLQRQTNAKVVKITTDGAISSIPEEKDYNAKELKRALSSNTDDWIRYNCVIYTPTITTGISFNETKHFYKKFIFCSTQSCDATETVQMIYREHCVISKEIVVCSINNRLNTLKYCPVEDTYNKEAENFNRLTRQQNNFFVKSNDKKTATYKVDSSKSLYDNLNHMENFFKSIKDDRIINDIFQKCYDWGSQNLISNLYKKRDKKVIEPKIIDKEPVFITKNEKQNNILELEKEAFYEAKYLNEITDEDTDDNKKSWLYRKYKISPVLWYSAQKIKASLTDEDNEDDNEGNTDEEERTEDDEEDDDKLINECDKINVEYLKILNDSRFYYYKKCCNIRFYEVKHIIYSIFENCFTSNLTLEDLQIRLKNKNDIPRLLYPE